MVEQKKYSQILSDGLMLDHYFILCEIREGKKLNTSKRVMGFLNLLNKKGYIKDDHLTDKAIDLIDNCPECKPAEQPKKVLYTDYDTWAKNLYKKCQHKLLELTGSTQVQAKLDRTTYSFLCNEKDFSRNISKVMVGYKLTDDDYDKIESTILRFISKCSREKNWFPLMRYYIMKKGESQMVTDLNDLTPEEEGGYKSTQKFI